MRPGRDTKGFQETRARNREIIDAGRQAKLRGKLRECGLFEGRRRSERKSPLTAAGRVG